MKRSSSFIFTLCLIATSLLLAFLLVPRLLTPASATLNPQQVVQRAWELARQSGSYHFVAQVDQVNIPLSIPTNVGKKSTQQSVRLEGMTNLAERKMEFTLNAQGGSPLDTRSGTQIKIDGDQAYSRQGQQAWQKIDDFSGSFAPQSDFMAFLSGAKNIRLAETDAVNGVTRYAFEVDGPGFSAYMQEKLIHQLADQGKLPVGVEVNLSEQLSSLSGTGEILIGADGLPVRQVLHLQFPPTSQDQSQADVQVSFTDFAPLSDTASSGLSLLEKLNTNLHTQSFRNAWLSAALVALAILILSLGLSHKPVYIAIIITLIVAMVVCPILQSAQAAEFVQKQYAQAQAQAQRQQITDLAQDIKSSPEVSIDPNTSPLDIALANQAPAGQAAAAQIFAVGSDLSPSSIYLPDRQVASKVASPTSNQDSDGDGLKDKEEERIGTNPTLVDTDGDTLSDYVEVHGFQTADVKTWYGDPRNKDTNGDGIGDNREWGLDTDGDFLPDMWSNDNDSDGVPDKVDLSPFQQGVKSYDGDNPFSFQFNELTENTPTYVEIQVRPVNVDHLRYAFAVRDWPNGDLSGQIMDEDGKTFKDINPESDSPQDAYGDVKLIPMLEIQIEGSPDNLPDVTILQSYGITVRNINSDGSQKAVYVPLQVATDSADAQRAFYGKMFYMPASSWGNPHLVRLVWVVQALVDVCKEDGFEDGVCKDFETYNDLQAVQTYYDAYTLTGLNVREDHGNQWAVVYKDPTAITETPKTTRINQLSPLNDLVFGLEHSFLAGRVTNGVRDFPVTEIKQRFDHTQNTSIPVSPDRFGIKDNILKVEEYQYGHIDLAYASMTITETAKILDVYTPYWSASQPITPTLVFAHEEVYRPLNLDSMGSYSNISVSPDGSQYSLSLPSNVPSGSSMAPIVLFTATALSWAPYVYQDGEWRGAPLDGYLDDLAKIYPPETIDSDPATGEGGLMFLEAYYANIYQGFFNVVEEGENVISLIIEESDEAITKYMEDWEIVLEPIKIGFEVFYEESLLYRISDFIARVKFLFSDIYFEVTGKGNRPDFPEMHELEKISGVGLAAEIIAGIAWLITHIPPIHEKLDESVWGKIFIVAISASFVVITGLKMVNACSNFSHAQAGMNGSKASESGVAGLIIITAILILVNVAIFIYIMATHPELNGVQVGLMVANLIANIIVIIIFALISQIPVIGPLIVAIYNLVNTILSEFFGISMTETLLLAITEIIFKADPMVSLTPTVGETNFGFLSDGGVSVGNSVNIVFPMDVLARQEDPQTGAETSWAYTSTDTDLYGTRVTLDIDGNESAVTSNSQWVNRELDHHYRGEDASGTHVDWAMYRAHANLTGSLDTITFTKSGINIVFPYDSEFHFKIHYYRCVLLIFCKDKTTSSSIEDEDPNLIFDVLPADIDTFFDWNWDADNPLPPPYDQDNDTLTSLTYNGNDPDDTRWDSDGDQSSDSWEMVTAAKPAIEGGFAFNPTSVDTDGDRLNDREEALLGTDPTLVDTDGDGRSDYAEVTGYQFSYVTGESILVRTSPLDMDTDSDGLDDKVEYDLYQMNPVDSPYNPTVWNAMPFRLSVEAGASGYIYPGASFPLNITLYNSTDTPIEGDVTTVLPANVTPVYPTTQSFEVLGQNTTALTNQINVALKIPSSFPLTISSSACGTLETPLVYLPFEEPAGATTFVNQEAGGTALPLGLYDATCVGQKGCPTAGVTGRLGNAVRFNGSTQRLALNQSAEDLEFSSTQPFSLSVWVNPDKPTRTDPYYILGKTDNEADLTHGYNLYLYPDGTGGYYIGFNNELKEYHFLKTVSASTWTHIVASSDGLNLRVYVNGSEINGTDTGNLYYLGSSTSPVTLGAVLPQGSNIYNRNFVGALDELYIFDRTLSDTEISNLANLPLAFGLESQNTSDCQLSASQQITVTVDTDSPLVNITSPSDGAWLDGLGYLVAGGEAHDPTSFVKEVQVSVDGSAFGTADGKESWTYLWDLHNLAEGAHILDVRAIDAVGSVGTVSRSTIHIDRSAPPLYYSSTSPNIVRFKNMQNWYFPMSGNAPDAGSGLASVEVLLDGGPDLPYGGWQAATVIPTAQTWWLDYVFPVNVVDLRPVPSPSGKYTLTLRAMDKVGNVSTLTYPQVEMDNTPPLVSLTSLSPGTIIVSPLTVSGVITDTSTVSGLSVALVPVEQAEVIQDAALVMHLNESADSDRLSFMDASGFNQVGYSEPAHAPDSVHIPGKVDEAVTFSGTNGYIKWREPLKTSFTSTITVAMWFKTTKTAPVDKTTLLALDHAAALYWKSSGGLTFSVTDSTGKTFEASSNKTLADGGWHHVLGVWDGTNFSIYIDGALAGTSKIYGLMGLMDTSTSLLTVGNSAAGVNGFGGAIDEVMLFQRGITSQEAANLYKLGNITWNSATVSGPNNPVSTWYYPLPSGLEGLYEIELRGIDDAGNRNDNTQSWAAWQGEIDLLAPRLTLSTINQGITSQVTCTSIDFNLSKTGYQCPCTTMEGDETTYDQVDNWYRNVIADNTRLYRILSTCSVDTGTPLQMQACDIYGACSTTTALASSGLTESEFTTATEVTATPEILDLPEVTPTPEIITATEVTALTEIPDMPEVTPIPEIITITEVTVPPEITPTPEIITATEVTATPEEPLAPQVSLVPISAVVDPVDHSVFTSLDPITLSLRAEAYSGLREINLMLDGILLTTFNFPDPSVTGTVLTTTWTLTPDQADGPHIFQSTASDWAGQVQTEFYPTTLFLDILPPSVDISPTVITSTLQIANGSVMLGGPVSDLAGVISVQVALQDITGTLKPAVGPYGALDIDWNPASVLGDHWSYPWRPDAGLDGQVYSVAVQASDLGAHTTLAVSPVIVDIIPPSPITITLSYVNSLGNLTPVSTGETIRDVLNPTLFLDWTLATDGSGVRSYRVGLSQQDPPDLVSLTPVSPDAPLQFSQIAGEAQAYMAWVVSEDTYGNLSWNHFGPIFVDTPLTPDLITLPSISDDLGEIYHGWMNSGESQIAINRIISDTVPLGFSLNGEQRFYLSWDATALRIAWLGASWDSEGDLFIYLKTGSGLGSDQAYNPYPVTSSDSLTLPFTADTLFWVTSASSAQMLRWNGAAWYDALPGGLGLDTFRFTANSPRSVTDLYLPFALLGIPDPANAPLDLIAFGTQEQALRLWTVFPIINPHDSPILSRLLDLLPDQHNLVMKYAFHWSSLALSQSPNLSRFSNDADVRSLLISNPLGVISDTRKSGLYLSKLFHFTPSAALIGDSQVITYTLRYLNIGGASLPDDHLSLVITSTLSLKLPGGQLITQPDGTQTYHQEIDLGAILPGTNSLVQFSGVVDVRLLEVQYELCLSDHPGDPGACQSLYDQLHDVSLEAVLTLTSAPDVELNRFTIKHPVVVDPPVDVEILSLQEQTQVGLLTASQADRSILPAAVLDQALSSPPIYVHSGKNTLQGSAKDPSGISSVTVQVLDPDGDTTDTSCSVAAPLSGGWSCAVTLAGTQNDLRYYARAQATNPFGYTSEWSSWWVLVIDALPPEVSLDAASEVDLAQPVIGKGKVTLNGTIQDNNLVRRVEICHHLAGVAATDKCKLIDLTGNFGVSGTWSITLNVPLGVDYASQTLLFYGWDAVGNRSILPVERSVFIDTAAPDVAIATRISTISLNSYMFDPEPILTGTASDASGVVDIVVRMSAPGLGSQRTVIPVQNNQWVYIPDISAIGVYSLSLEARDIAGNLTTLGSWTLAVTDGFKIWLPIITR
jgi:hypothetical protein